jgi:hypothetical protein
MSSHPDKGGLQCMQHTIKKVSKERQQHLKKKGTYNSGVSRVSIVGGVSRVRRVSRLSMFYCVSSCYVMLCHPDKGVTM